MGNLPRYSKLIRSPPLWTHLQQRGCFGALNTTINSPSVNKLEHALIGKTFDRISCFISKELVRFYVQGKNSS